MTIEWPSSFHCGAPALGRGKAVATGRAENDRRGVDKRALGVGHAQLQILPGGRSLRDWNHKFTFPGRRNTDIDFALRAVQFPCKSEFVEIGERVAILDRDADGRLAGLEISLAGAGTRPGRRRPC